MNITAGVIGSVYYLREERPRPAPLLHTLGREPNLVGRSEELGRLVDRMRPGTGSTGIPIITGMGGIGKTALALATAHAARREGLFTAYYFLDFHGYTAEPNGPLAADAAVTRLLGNLGVPQDEVPADADARVERYRGELADWSSRGEHVLLVADNVSSWEQVSRLLPGDSGHRLLVTSRRTLPAPSDQTVMFELGLLADEDAQRLLALRVGDQRFGQGGSAKAELAALCGGLPLALDLVIGLLTRQPELPPAHLVEYLAEEQERLEELDRGASVDSVSGDRRLRAVFGLSYLQLKDAERRLFTLLSIAPGEQSSPAAAASLAELTTVRARRMLADLRAANLLLPCAAPEHYAFHDLVRLYAREHAEQLPAAERTAATDRLLDHLTRTTKAADSHLDPTGPSDSWFGGRPQALAWLTQEWRQLVAATEFAARNGRPAHCSDLALALSHFLDMETLWDDLHRVAGLGLSAARQLPDRKAEIRALRSLGTADGRHRRFAESIDHCEEALRIARETNDRVQQAHSLLGLGANLQDAGRLDQARQAFTEALATYAELGDRHGQAIVHHDLGMLLDALTEYDEVAAHYRQAVGGYREFGDQYREALVLRCWGAALADRHDFDGALSRYQESLALCLRIGDRQGQAAALANMSLAHHKSGRPDEAVRTCREALEIAEELHNLSLTGQVLLNLGVATALSPDRREFVGDVDKAIGIYRTLGDRWREAAALVLVGHARTEIDGEVQHGVEQLLAAAERFREIGEREHEADTLCLLGSGYQKLGELQTAIGYQHAAIEVFQGLGHDEGQGRALHMLGDMCFINGRLEEAISALTDALPFHQKLGQLHQEAAAHSGIGNANLQLNRFQGADEHLHRALDLHRQLGNRTDEAFMLMQLGDSSIRAGRPAEAAPHLHLALDAFRALGLRSQEGFVLGGLGTAAFLTGRRDDALPLFQQATDCHLAVGDEAAAANGHLSVAEVAEALGDGAEMIRNCELAVPLLERTGNSEGAERVRAFLAERAEA
ncbi:tetratricopeptide repeat protein [Streptomyces murinus]|uniref:tetratricopeptide repeat protein n=1 Tax=Streptomyces murinus TaxID=33900 RepID=UPI003F457FA2